MTASENFRENIKTQMARRKMDQINLAGILKTSNSYVNRVLRGKMEPSLARAEEFADAVGLTLLQAIKPPKRVRKSA